MTDNRQRILYIEDNLENRTLAQRILMASGYEVVVAASGAEGLELAARERLTLILVDINMPEIDGYTVTSQLREMPHLARVPIIALTANVMRGDREKTLAAGCDGYIQKPIDIDLFPQQLARFIEEAQPT
jgi:two-component system cell cycle response regulator DivK